MRKKFFAICLVSVVSIAVLVPGCVTPPVDQTGMDDAINVVGEDILPNIPEIQDGNPYWCLKLDSSLPEKTVIEEDSGSTLRITLEEETFFFYLDLAPGTFYEHPVKYILVDKEGNHEEYDASWWPRIDGDVPQGLVQSPPAEDDVVSCNIEIEYPYGSLMEFVFPFFISQWCEGFIVVQGLMTDEVLFDCAEDTYENGMAFFNAYKNDYSQVVGLTQSQARDVLDTIDDMVDDGLSQITIYIIAHGRIDEVKLGGQWFTADQFRNKMAAHPATIFNFILGSCHSGSFIDDLSTLDNVYTVVTACGHYQGAAPDWDTKEGLIDSNPTDTGSEWTSSLLEAMSQIVEDEAKLNEIRDIAVTHGVTETCVLICEASHGALGANPTFGMTQDLDLSHRYGNHNPDRYCSYSPSLLNEFITDKP